MKRACASLLLLLFSVMASETLLAQQNNPEQEVRQAFSAFSRAFREADVAALQKLLTTNYIHVNGRTGSVLNRDAWLKWVASRREELARRTLVISTYDVKDVEVEVYGQTAVLTGVVQFSGEQRGVKFSRGVRFTNVWVKQGNEWRRAAFHDSPLPESSS